MSDKIQCSCGAVISSKSLFNHLKTTKHNEYLQYINKIKIQYENKLNEFKREIEFRNELLKLYDLYHIIEDVNKSPAIMDKQKIFKLCNEDNEKEQDEESKYIVKTYFDDVL